MFENYQILNKKNKFFNLFNTVVVGFNTINILKFRKNIYNYSSTNYEFYFTKI